LGIDPQLAPNAGLSTDTLVLSLSPLTSQRLLQSTPVVQEGVLQSVDQPLASAVFFDFAGLIDTLTPWITYGFAVSQDIDMQNVILPFQDILDVLKCFQNVTAVTYQEGDVWITHSESHFRDLP
jgi:hypothetical protein